MTRTSARLALSGLGVVCPFTTAHIVKSLVHSNRAQLSRSSARLSRTSSSAPFRMTAWPKRTASSASISSRTATIPARWDCLAPTPRPRQGITTKRRTTWCPLPQYRYDLAFTVYRIATISKDGFTKCLGISARLWTMTQAHDDII